jgi:hypothetical protein
MVLDESSLPTGEMKMQCNANRADGRAALLAAETVI